MLQEGLSYQEAARIYEVQGHGRIQSWERIYLEEGPESLAIERRGRGSTGRPKKLPKQSRRGPAGRSSAAACRECLPKKLASLGFGRRATPAQKTQVVQKLRQEFSLALLLTIAQLPRATFYYHLKRMGVPTDTKKPKQKSRLSTMKTRADMVIAASQQNCVVVDFT